MYFLKINTYIIIVCNRPTKTSSDMLHSDAEVSLFKH